MKRPESFRISICAGNSVKVLSLATFSSALRCNPKDAMGDNVGAIAIDRLASRAAILGYPEGIKNSSRRSRLGAVTSGCRFNSPMHPRRGCHIPAQVLSAQFFAFYDPMKFLILPTMGSTFYSIHHHVVFSTKNRRPFLKPPWRANLFAYMGGTVGGLGGVAEVINGVEDHVH